MKTDKEIKRKLGFGLIPHNEAPFQCQYCGRPSYVDPADQLCPPDHCHEIDHGQPEPEGESK